MPRFPVRDRLIPYRILVFLLYGNASWRVQLESGEQQLAIGPASRHFRITVARMRDQLQWLHAQGFLTTLETDRNAARFRIRPAQ